MKTKLSFIGRLFLFLWCGFIPIIGFTQQIPRSLTAANGTFIGFYEYKPVTYTAEPNRKYPLIIFLHGMGERGNGTTELPRVKALAIPRYIDVGHTMTFTYNGQTETFLVLSPQLPTSIGWWPSFYTEEMIKYAKNNLRIDTNRIYLTGVSLGGGGAWRFASESYANAKQLAALAPVCGTCDWGNVCSSIASANLPVWAFHAQDDGLVGVGCTTGAVSMINSCNPQIPALQSIYPTGNHWIWDMSYDTAHAFHSPNMYEWFLSKTRAGTAPGPNIPPIARAGVDQTITLPANAVTLNGSASSDPDGTISAFSWSKIGGPSQYSIASPNGIQTSVNNLEQGVYSFQLTVTDNRGATAMDTVLVTVNAAGPAPNVPPVALAGTDQNITLPNSNTYVFGSGSYDPDGVINTFTWTQVNGPSTAAITTLSASNINVSNLAQGTYSFRLLVTDNQGGTDDDTMSVVVHSPNTPPVANAGNDQAIQLPTNSVTLNGSGSTDADGTVSGYAWTKIAGPAQYNIANANTVSASVTNLAAGTYSFRLVVTDNNGASDDDTVIVTVAPAPPPPNGPPVARAGNDQSIQLPTSNVTLDGSASADADGSIVSYAWTKVAGPAQYNIVSAGTVSTVVNNLGAGTYSFRLVVTDNTGATDDDTVVINVAPAPPPPNTPPTANAGSDQAVQLPTSNVTLDGVASSDADGSITSYAWTKIAGPAQYNIANANAVSTSVTNLVAGTYSFRLVVTDDDGATDDDTVVVVVSPAPPPPNVPPVANAGNDQSIQLPVNNVTLDGAASTDADGTIASYAWSKIAGPAQYNITNGNTVSPSVTNLVAGTYSFRLVVTDNSGATDADTVVINVAPAPPPPNVAPTANAGGDQSIQLPTNSVTLNGAASSDADGTIVLYAWTKIAGPAQYNISNAGAVSTPVANLAAGTYAFRLTVTDDDGATDSDTVVVNVGTAPPPPNVPPVANAGNDQSIQLPANNVTLDGAASTDADGTITSYAWSKIAGPAQYNIANANTVSASVTNLAAGTYSFRLVVSDNNGATDDDTVVIVVAPAPPPPNVAPTANAGGDQSVQLPTNNVTLDGSASSDADGSIVSYTWTKIAGPTQYNISNANTVSASVTNLAVGTYAFRLVVTDNDGATDDDTVIVNVSMAPPPPNVPPVANAGNDQAIQLPNNATLNGSGSTDADGTITGYAWSKIAGPAQFNISSAGSAAATVSNLAVGTYTFRLVVTDNSGATDDDTVVITVAPAPNLLPVSIAGNDTIVHLPNASAVLNGSTSYDPDGNIVSYSWNRVSGPAGVTIVNATLATAGMVATTAGEYIFELTITDNDGATATDQVKVTVLQSANHPPVARAGTDTTVAVPQTAAWLMGLSSYDPDGTIVGYQWKQLSGPAPAFIHFPNVPYTAVNNLIPGEYTFELTVTDNGGASDKDSVQISVFNNLRYEEVIEIYPNPASVKAYVRCISDSTGEITLRIIDANGKFVKSIRSFKAQSYFEQGIMLTDLRPGMYYLEALIGDKKRMIKKFIKQ